MKKGMNLQEIKKAVNSGKKVYWSNENYEVVKDMNSGQFLILSKSNKNAIGLTWQDGTTLNGKEEDFYIKN